jgi:hypothetical protein
VEYMTNKKVRFIIGAYSPGLAVQKVIELEL